VRLISIEGGRTYRQTVGAKSATCRSCNRCTAYVGLWHEAVVARTAALARGRAKTPAFNLRVESSSRFGESESQKFWRRLYEEGNRENDSTLSWLAHVFTRPGPKAALEPGTKRLIWFNSELSPAVIAYAASARSVAARLVQIPLFSLVRLPARVIPAPPARLALSTWHSPPRFGLHCPRGAAFRAATRHRQSASPPSRRAQLADHVRQSW
jgi:hypothetical protein